MGFANMATGFIKTSKGATPRKMEVCILCNIIMKVTSCPLGNILLVKSESQILPTYNERGSHKDMNIER